MKRAIVSVSAIFLGAFSASAETLPVDVVYIEGAVEGSLTGVAGDAATGKIVMTTRGLGNCIACHSVGALEESPFHGEVGPPLDGAGERWTEAELRGIVSNAKMTFEDSMMPAFYKTTGYIRPGNAFTGKPAEGDLPPLLMGQQIEDVVAFLVTLKE